MRLGAVLLLLCGFAAAKHGPDGFPLTIELRSEESVLVAGVAKRCRTQPATTSDVDVRVHDDQGNTYNGSGSITNPPTTTCQSVPTQIPYRIIRGYEVESRQAVSASQLNWGGALKTERQYGRSLPLGTYKYRVLSGNKIEVLRPDGKTIKLLVRGD